MAEHLARYRFASEIATGTVLDCEAGVGYGAYELIRLGRDIQSVVCLDVDRLSLAYGKSHYHDGRLFFVQGTAMRLPFAAGSFHTVVCFEVIEHLDDPRPLLQELRRIIKKKGQVIISTPNALCHQENPNVHHVGELTQKELLTLVEQFMQVEQTYTQWYFLHITQLAKSVIMRVLHKLGVLYRVLDLWLKLLGRGGVPTGHARPASRSFERLLMKLTPRPVGSKPLRRAANIIVVARKADSGAHMDA